MRNHVVICNCNEKVRGVVHQLLAAHNAPKEIALLVQDAELWAENPHWHPELPAQDPRFWVREGCPSDAEDLESVQIAEARAAVILADPQFGTGADSRSALVAIAIERKNPQVHTVMELLDSMSRLHVRSTEVNEIICLGEISEKLIAQSCISPGVQHIFEHLLQTESGTERLTIAELPPAAYGETYRELCRQVIRSHAPITICGFIRRQQEACYVLNPPGSGPLSKDTTLEAGDALMIIANEVPALDALFSSVPVTVTSVTP